MFSSTGGSRAAAAEAWSVGAVPVVWVARLLLASLGLTSCGAPGVVLEVYNHTPERVVVRQVFNDASETSEGLEPGARGEFGPALSWHVALSGTLVEIRHPGDDFAEPRPFGQQLFRFQVEAPGCLFVLLPEQHSPVTELPAQPRGYPLGTPGSCASIGTR